MCNLVEILVKSLRLSNGVCICGAPGLCRLKIKLLWLFFQTFVLHFLPQKWTKIFEKFVDMFILLWCRDRYLSIVLISYQYSVKILSLFDKHYIVNAYKFIRIWHFPNAKVRANFPCNLLKLTLKMIKAYVDRLYNLTSPLSTDLHDRAKRQHD